MQRHNSLISSDMRILLHLLRYRSSKSQFDVPIGLTQIGIAQKIDIKRGYIHRPLNKLIEEGYIQEGVGHTKCGKRKIKYFFFTDDGKKYARKIEMEISNLLITLILSDGTSKTMEFKNIKVYLDKNKTCQGITNMDICTNLSKDCSLDIESLNNIK
jgi:DNA-binding MarR family transcriptional regulator